MKPTREGFYWLRNYRQHPPMAVLVTFYKGEPPRVDFAGIEQSVAVDDITGEWSGPLVSPWEGEKPAIGYMGDINGPGCDPDVQG